MLTKAILNFRTRTDDLVNKFREEFNINKIPYALIKKHGYYFLFVIS